MESSMDGQRETILLGRITGAHGLKGWVKVHSDTEPRDAIFDYQPWQVGPENELIRIVSGRVQGKYLVAQLDGIDDRDTAESMAGLKIEVFRDQLPDLPDTQFYWADLAGLAVFTEAGRELGTIREMVATGADDVMIVQGDRERLIPFIHGTYVISVDLDAGRIVVDWDPDF